MEPTQLRATAPDDFRSALHLAHGELTDRILRAFYTVHTELRGPLPERLYQNALPIELKKLGLAVKREVPLVAKYDDIVIGEYRADLIVEDSVLVEIKSVEKIADVHRNQVLTYLRFAKLRVGLLLNFGPEAQVRRLIL